MPRGSRAAAERRADGQAGRHGAKARSVCVDTTPACLTGRMASMWSSRLRVPPARAVPAQRRLDRRRRRSTVVTEARRRRARAPRRCRSRRRWTLPVGPVGNASTTWRATGRLARTSWRRGSVLIRIAASRGVEARRGRRRRRRRRLPQHDVGHGDLAQLGVVAPRPRPRRPPIGIRADDLFDLPGEHLLAAPVDHVVGPGVQVDEPVGVRDARGRPCRSQPSGSKRSRCVAAHVAADDRRATDLDVPDRGSALEPARRPVRLPRRSRSSTPDRQPDRARAAAGPASGLAVIWLAASVMP